MWDIKQKAKKAAFTTVRQMLLCYYRLKLGITSQP